jgi:protein-tyrosine phosphatase
MAGFIDIHCHILPGLDDGPEGLQESLAMVRMAADDGISPWRL